MTEQEIIEYCKTNKVAIHCPTQEDYNRFTEMLEREDIVDFCTAGYNYFFWDGCSWDSYNDIGVKSNKLAIKTVSELMNTGTDTWKIQDLTSKQITKCENFTEELLSHLKGLTARQQDAFIKKVRGDMK